jgi:GTP-binding protein EngB required for normal cell division
LSDSAADAIRRYDELKLEVGAIAQTAMLRCAKAKDQAGEREFQRLLARLTQDRFNLAVVGPFSRGKSSLMNALLGFDALPTGLLPHTSVVTTVTYGPRERVLIRSEGWPFPQEIRVDQLEDYVTERGNPGNRRHIALAEIQLPAEMLRRGLHFIDTPGVGSAILANTNTTESFLSEIDAAIFVTSFDSAISENDLEFLARVRATVGVVFVVLNKLDLISDSERDDVVRFVAERFERDPLIGRCDLFSVSAKRGLQAKLEGDSAALARSGVPELEAALAEFLSTNKIRQLSSRIVDRLITSLRRQHAAAELVSAANQSAQHRADALQDLDRRLVELKTRLNNTFAGLAPLGDSTLRALEPRINAGFRRLKRDLQRKFESSLSGGRRFLNPAMRSLRHHDAAAFCSGAINRELPLYEAALNEEWRRQAGPLLATIRGLPEEFLVRTSNREDSIDASLKGHTEESDGIELRIGQIPQIDWRPHLQWWLRLVPPRLLTALLRKSMGEQLDGVLAQYRYRLESAIRLQIDACAADLMRKIDNAIDVRAQHLRQSMVLESFAADGEKFDDLLRQAHKLRHRLDSRLPSSIAPEAIPGMRTLAGTAGRDDTAGRIRPCPVCRAVVEAVFADLSRLQYELGTEVGAQKHLAETGGFCSAHTWIYSSLASPVGISRAYSSLLEADAQKLEIAGRTAGSLEALTSQVSAISPSRLGCKVCALASRTMRETMRKIQELLANGTTPIPTLCLPHIEMALRCGVQLESGRALAHAAAQAMSRTSENMRRHGLKHDALRRDLMTTEERNAGRVGLQELAGEMLLMLPPREDDRF